MRARIKFTTELVPESLIGVLKEHHWWPHFEQNSEAAIRLKQEVRDSVEEGDVDLFDDSQQIILSHTPTESRGTIALEHQVWVVRLLNPSIHLLQLACEEFVAQVASYATINGKKISFPVPIQIVERKRKETIIEGRALSTQKERMGFARIQKNLEFRISIGGVICLLVLVLLTFPWSWRHLQSPRETWMFSVFEKFIGSVAVTTLISYLGYRSFLGNLRDHAIKWSIPGQPEKLEVKAGAAA